ncbi:PP2C family protein-serine/threonine phosphatase [Streptomyces sp. NPDC054904]|uniref:PP2C family protein-serine/threonine phosphatase n=1 Tax=unclassified Streptomyces TaxID=2593676 RepID=UPI002481E3DA|nr:MULTISPECIES: SpoIIE family protein phosphatase [unclassified Streptomyces]MDA5285476.1 SpoIIE family protein phosphatase [Streptomyces sp. Isolate_45]MDX2390458.1 SpoIIE family protein phosphatase [Streptomyces sp. DK15]
MPSHLYADLPAQPPEPGSVDALISQTRRLRGEVDAVRRDTVVDDDDAQGRWQRALCDLAVHHLDDLRQHLGQLKEGLPPAPEHVEAPQAAPEATAEDRPTRVGSAEWNLLTDEVTWSEELFQIFGRSPEAGALPLDELGSTLFSEDQPTLTAMVTDCLVDGKPIDGEFRIVRADGRVRTLHMRGEPVLDSDGCTASMWAVLRDVSELRRSQRAVRESHDSLQRRREIAQTEHRLAVELQEAVLPPWRGSLRFPHDNAGALDVAAHYLPSATSALIGGDWYDALELPDGRSLLTVGDLTGHGVSATSGMAMMLGALRGMAMAGIEPGPLMGWLNQLLETSVQPALGSAVCCRYDPVRRVLSWAQAGHPAPLLFRRGQGRPLLPPEGVLLGATSGAVYGQAEERLEAGDVLVLHTDGLTPRSIEFSRADGTERLLALAPRFSAARSARDCVRMVTEEFGESEREDDACILVARIGD